MGLKAVVEADDDAAVAAHFGWDLTHEYGELSELFVLLNAETVELLDGHRRLVHEGNWFDDGILMMRVRVKATSAVLDVYNVHFAGGSFGKPPEMLEKKRRQREAEFGKLEQSILGMHDKVAKDGAVPDAIVIAGDFNCDPDPQHRKLFPEAVLSLEFWAPEEGW